MLCSQGAKGGRHHIASHRRHCSRIVVRGVIGMCTNRLSPLSHNSQYRANDNMCDWDISGSLPLFPMCARILHSTVACNTVCIALYGEMVAAVFVTVPANCRIALLRSSLPRFQRSWFVGDSIRGLNYRCEHCGIDVKYRLLS